MARCDAAGNTVMIVNDLAEMDLMTTSDKNQLGEKLRQCLDEEFVQEHVAPVENDWSEV